MKVEKVVIYLFQIIICLYFLSAIKLIHENELLINIIKWSRVILIAAMLYFVLIQRHSKFIFSKKLIFLFIPLLFNILDIGEIFYVDYILLLIMILIVLNISSQSLDLIILNTSKLYIILIFIILVLYIFNIIQINEYTEFNNRVRNTLGFYNPNASSLFINISIIGFIYLEKIKPLIISIFIGIFVFYFTNSRSLVLMISLGIIYLLSFRIMKIKKIIYILSYPILFISFLLPIFVQKLIDYEIAGFSLNFLTSERLLLIDNQLKSFSDFQIFFGNFHANIVDNLFINILSTTGLFIYLMLFIFIFCAILYNKNNYNNLFIILSFMCVNNFESYYSSANLITILFLFLILNTNSIQNSIISRQNIY